MLKNGGSIEFIARSKSSGRGFTVDVLVCDEAQELTDEQMEAIQPAISSAPSGNPLTIYTGTPTPPTSPGHGVRAHAPQRASRQAAEEPVLVRMGGDRDRRRARPATLVPIQSIARTRLLKSVVVSESEKMTPDGFARERLGWWNDQAGALSDIDVDEWAKCKTDKPCMDGYNSYAVKFSADGANVTLVACVRPPRKSSELPHVEVIASRSMRGGTGWLADWLTAEKNGAERWRNAIGIIIDGRVGAPTLVNSLIDKGVSKRVIVVPRPSDVADACSMLEQAVNDHGLTHFGQPLLDEAVGHAKHRKIGDGFGYEPSMENIDVSPVEAVALAYWNVKTSKRHPGRRAKAVAF